MSEYVCKNDPDNDQNKQKFLISPFKKTVCYKNIF